MRKLLTIEGMSCGHCTMHVQSALEEIPGVTKVDVDLIKKSAMVEGDGDNFNDVALKRAVSEAGYRVTAVLGGR
ncbi:MAG: heavy metal transport/detoxification protein [Spirochaetae bacterium HGW-Spirochaetae-9]|jgi:copper chaperone|nr:MAG: heavy metal transport/detoxification protein [Spirochaetae bacterium HGW-Spirochaetae-9]